MSYSNIQLANYCKQLNIPLEFIGDSKEFKIIDNKPKAYILLLNGNGSHWVALYCTSDNAFYFDAFGEYANNYTEIEILKHYKKYIRQTADIQDIKHGNCGLYCLDFLNYMHNNPGRPTIKKYENFVKKYKDYNFK